MVEKDSMIKESIKKRPLKWVVSKLLVLTLLVVAGILVLSDYLGKEYMKSQEEQRKDSLKRLVLLAYNTIKPELEDYHSGKLDRKAALLNIRNTVRNMIFPVADGNNYIFMSSYNGIMLVQPFESEKEMTSQLNLQDLNGKYFIKELIKTAKNNKEGGYVSYFHQPPWSTSPEEKMSYVMGLPGLDCYIGAGLYMGDIRKRQASFRLKECVLQLVFIVLLLFLVFSYVYEIWKKNKMLRREVKIRQESEKNSKKSEAHLKTLIEIIPDLVWLKDLEGVYISCNHRFEAFFGAHETEIIGRSDHDFVDKELADFFREKDKAVMRLKKTCMNEEEITYASDGHKELLETMKTPMYDCDGNLIGVLGVARDVTLRKKQEKELKKLRNFLFSIINSMPSILIGVDIEGKVTQWNQKTEEYTGISTVEATGRPLQEVLPEMSEDMEEIISSINARRLLVERKRQYMVNGEERFMDVTIYPLDTDPGEGAVIRIDDVTKEYCMEEQLAHSRKMDAIGQLAGGVAHDFNNMLGGILSAADLMTSPRCNIDEKAKKYVSIIIDAASKAADLTSKLLAFARKGKMAATVINLHDVVEDTVLILKRTIDKKVIISVEKDADKPYVIGDASSLQNSLINLGINSSQAMPEGGKILIKTSNVMLNEAYCNESLFDINPGEYVRVEIIDTGSGIPTDDLEKIFEPFFTTKPQGEGTGLGLAAVYGSVQEHNGEIIVSSKTGEGTEFRINLPCVRKKPVNDGSDLRVIQGSGNILLVDDEEIIRETGKYILEEMGYNVSLAENGLKAVEMFKLYHKEIDLVILDMLMPEMDGYETFIELKRIEKDCRIIISSGYSEKESIKELYQLGVAGVVRKPYRNSELSLVITKVLENKK